MLNDKTITGESGAGLVRVTYDTIGRPISVEIADEIFSKEDKQLVSDLFVAAIRDVHKKLDQITTELMLENGLKNNPFVNMLNNLKK